MRKRVWEWKGEKIRCIPFIDEKNMRRERKTDQNRRRV
jgi:hypothetical protein